MIFLLWVPLVFVAGVLIIGFSISGPRYRGPVTDHFDGRKFVNPVEVKVNGFGEVILWMIRRKRGPWRERRDLSFGARPDERVMQGIRVTFVNHSTFLIQVEGLNILTDPVWSKRTSPVEWAGPKRMRTPGLRLEDLPPIDVILLSHNHWDHLDIATMKKIHFTHKPTIITALGVGRLLDLKGVTKAIDLDWWQETSLGKGVTVQAVPAQHFSGRGTFDRDATLWCGFVIRRKGGNIYFAGDTGYNGKTFKEIGERCTPIRIALVPIGAYKPTWFMSPIHCSPEEAILIHQDAGAEISIASHFGTFPLADDGEAEPVDELKKAIERSGLSQESFIILEEGVSKDF